MAYACRSDGCPHRTDPKQVFEDVDDYKNHLKNCLYRAVWTDYYPCPNKGCSLVYEDEDSLDRHKRWCGYRQGMYYSQRQIGKVELASAYVRSVREKFDTVIWLFGDSRKSLNGHCNAICEDMGIRYPDCGPGIEKSQEALKRWLSKPLVVVGQYENTIREATWLLMIEAVPDMEILEGLLPSTGPGCIVITSSSGDLGSYATRTRTLSLELKPFDLRNSYRFLRCHCNRDFEEEKEYIYSHDMEETCRDLAGVIHGKPGDLADLFDAIDGSTVPITTKISIWEKHVSKPALALLQVLSFLDGITIKESMLKCSIGSKWMRRPLPQSVEAYNGAVAELAEKELIYHSNTLKQISINPMLQRVLRESLVRAERGFPDYDIVIACKDVFNHIKHIVHIWDVKSNAKNMDGMGVVKLMNEAAWYLAAKGEGAQCEAYTRIALAMFEGVPKDDRYNDLDFSQYYSQTLYYSAVSCIYNNKPEEAIKKLEEMIAIIKHRIQKWKNIPWQALELGDAYKEMGVAIMSKNDMKMVPEAIKWFFKAHDLFKSLPVDLHGVHPLNEKIDRDWPAIHLALVYNLHDGDNPMKVLQPDKISNGKALYALANIRRAQKRTAEAIDMYNRAIVALDRSIGQNYPVVADTYYSVAVLSMKYAPDDLMKARDLGFENAAGVYEKPSQSQKLQAARVAFTYGKWLLKTGNEVEGRRYLKRALRFWREMKPGGWRSADQLTQQDCDNEVWYFAR
ncbi:hypothetical protein QBC43DRAFT_292012 [Cladorrhinum sp. PSN259]|nr:hypothetical protein QBC43DRAFT_292012 [Cladorrhinum sp. PSN259]